MWFHIGSACLGLGLILYGLYRLHCLKAKYL